MPGWGEGGVFIGWFILIIDDCSGRYWGRINFTDFSGFYWTTTAKLQMVPKADFKSHFCFNIYVFIYVLILIERERQRERDNAGERGAEREGSHRIRSRLQALRCRDRARHGARTHEPWDHDLSWSQMVNWLSHPGAPESQFWIFLSLARNGFTKGLLWDFSGDWDRNHVTTRR